MLEKSKSLEDFQLAEKLFTFIDVGLEFSPSGLHFAYAVY